MDNITIQNGRLCVDISPKGAELQRVVDANGIDRLWDGDPAFWAGRAPVLFPVAGGLKDDMYCLEDERYTLEKHGFARKRVFLPECVTPTGAAFLLTGEAGYHPGFPFAYALRAQYTLDADTLRAAYTVTNLDHRAFFYSTGAHEAYACPEGIEAYALAFEKPEPLAHSRLGHGGLTGEKEAIASKNGVLPLTPELFGNDTLVLADLLSRSVTLRSRLHGRTVRVDFADYPYLLIWTMPGAGFVCIEPWGNLPDCIDTDQNIAKKPGMICLSPGARHTQTHTMTFR